MKRILLILCVLGAALAALLAGFIYEKKEPSETDWKRFVCILPSEDLDYWGEVKAGISQADEELGTYTKMEAFEMFDVETQLQLLKESAYLPVDGVITVGEPYYEELNETIRSMAEEGTPVVLLDTDSAGSGRSVYIGSNNYDAGALAARQMREFTQGEAEIIVLITGRDSANQQERLDGFQDVVDQESGMEILAVSENKREKVQFQDTLNQLLEEYPQADAIFCAEASSTQQVALMLKNQTLGADLTVIGFDDLPGVPEAIEEGLMEGTILQDGYAMGYLAVYALSDELELMEDEKFYTSISCLTSEGMEDYRKRKESRNAAQEE